MEICFRVDSAFSIGLGHLSRCLALAAELSELGASCTFICKALPGSQQALVTKQGHKLVTLPLPEKNSTHANWFSDQSIDIQHTIQAITALNLPTFDWLVVDHYWLDKQWHKQLKPYTKKLMVIDDLANRALDCDLLLDQTPERNKQDYQPYIPTDSKVLCGSQFALLRKEFSIARDQTTNRTFKVPLSVIISLGGTDPDNIAAAIIEHINALPSEWFLKIQVMIATSPTSELTKSIGLSPHKIEIIKNSTNIAKLFASCDLVIGASGVSAVERCAVGTPSLLYLYAENQQNIKTALLNNKAALFIGSYQDRDLSSIGALISKLVFTPQKLDRMGSAAKKLCDGKGAVRVARYLCNEMLPITIIPADESHCEYTLQWQQHGQRRYSRNPQSPTEKEHIEWFEKTLSDENRHLFIITQLASPCGFIRFDKREGEQWEVSILVSKPWQQYGLASQALQWAKSQPQFHPITAYVHPQNKASQYLFEQAGFQRETTTHFSYK